MRCCTSLSNNVMDKFSARHPILFQLLVFIAAFILVLVVSLGASVTCSAEAEAQNMHVAIGRLIAGGVLFLVFIRYFNIKKQLSGIVVMLPALLFAVWNIVLHFSMGGARAENYAYALILGLAPAVFEEVVFRGVFIHNLRANGRSPMSALLISAIFFGVVHMTNLLGSQHIINVIIQVSYSIVVGPVFGAIYIRTGDLVSVIIAHSIIDISSKILPSGQVIAFQWCIALIALLVVETFYAVHLMHSMATDSTSGISSSAGTGEVHFGYYRAIANRFHQKSTTR